MKTIAFFDIELNPQTEKIEDIGCIRQDNAIFHKKDIPGFFEFVNDSAFICGHNILAHDIKWVQKYSTQKDWGIERAIDTLLFSPLLFPRKPYHSLLKDDKILTEERNNPVNDAKKARELFAEEVTAFNNLPADLKHIYFNLLKKWPGYKSFFDYIGFSSPLEDQDILQLIFGLFQNQICKSVDLVYLIREHPIELAHALSLIHCNDRYSITPPWVLKKYPKVETVLYLLRNNPCVINCQYCAQAFNPFRILKNYFGYDGFRKYDDEPLQEKAVLSAVNNNSLLAVFPTGGGKSITFQVPALMAGENAKALTVVISPLQSLMKDQVDNLEKKGITDAVTINGLLDPIERSKAIQRVEDGSAFILYISPESLRSVTIQRLLLKRKIARFVIDEAHCFSSWGQDFRVDYLYIGDFIKKLQELKSPDTRIPVSCFTATAKQKVIEDIRRYFLEKLGLNLNLYRATSGRKNLQYEVFKKDTDEEKYAQLRDLVESRNCPTIVYVSRTKRAYKLATRLTEDGLLAKAYHGKMDKEEKTANQNAFMEGHVSIMVATSAFGMGVDKDNVGLVIHYDISDSLENYVQEAGRAGRDENIKAECQILFSEDDLDKHFILLNQTRITVKEINQIWKAVKDLTKIRDSVSNSALEIARKAGWDESVTDIETRVTTAIAALEGAGYLKRGQNVPRVYANSILSANAQEAIDKINQSQRIEKELKEPAVRIIRKLFSSKSKRLSTEEAAESRVDYISDQLGIVKDRVIRIIELLRQEGILANTKDLTAFIRKGENTKQSLGITDLFRLIESFLLDALQDNERTYHLKELNENAIIAGALRSSPANIKTIINFWAVKNWIKKHYPEGSKNHVVIAPALPIAEIRVKLVKRQQVVKSIVEYLFQKATEQKDKSDTEQVLVEFSVLELKEQFENSQRLFNENASIDEVEDALFYLSRIDAIKIEGGFLVVHNKLSINRLETNNKIKYKESDYRQLNEFYQQKVQQIHIVGEYARKMIKNYNEALRFVDDYFNLNYPSFLNKYFPGSRETEIKRTLTPEKFKKLFGSLSVNQLAIINQREQHIVVAAGPGSGKTRVLVHKLASLLLTEDVKHEQLLMLTFSRAAATEFKKRLIDLIGNAAAYIEIKTFHSYCFDLLGKVGSLSLSENVVNDTVAMIRAGEIETNRITKTVLVVDEAQDMNKDEYELVKALMEVNEEMKVILVGDDDQNIYGFRGADSYYMQSLIEQHQAVKYELTENYRSKPEIVQFANKWAETISRRLKSQPGFPVQQTSGQVSVTQHTDNKLIVPVVNAILSASLQGTTAVLTRYNDEAMLVNGLLNKNKIPARLIQSLDSFPLSALYEIRYFSDLVLADPDSPVISNEQWQEAMRKIEIHARESQQLDLVLKLMKDFESVNSQRKYKSDWQSYLRESKLEDFVHADSETVIVGTIHKAKGKEFDNVFLLLSGLDISKDEDKRVLYVAITRARSNLQIHYTGSFLKSITAPPLQYQTDAESYGDPGVISTSLTHKDVVLGFFSDKQNLINNIFSGSKLNFYEGGLCNSRNQRLVMFSKAFKLKLDAYQKNGYRTLSAKAGFIVYWKDKITGNESRIILPEIDLIRE